MERIKIVEKLTPLVRESFEKNDLVLFDEMTPAVVDTWTSLSFMRLLEKVEKEFGVKFKMMELVKLNNIGAIVDAIARHC
ncbi:MAG: phosphopantetheine-binding protein [Bacteroidia bacterium]|nr:phosphopantetheine-binding protein [Bacteroidia bacterium]